MFTGFSLVRTVHAGMILLVLVASFPEVLCCCDVSWGPGGLFGSQALCNQRSAAKPKCCCCQHVENEERANDAPECSAVDCVCTFSIVSPAPMSTPRGVDLAPTPLAYAPLLTGGVAQALSLVAGSHEIVERAIPPLTPPGRCAFLQTWRI